MSKILLIGNSGFKHHGEDGQTIKVQIYLKKIQDEGFNVSFVDLEDFTKKPISTLFKIKKSIASCDRIVLISAKRGCKYLIPFINRVNKKFNKPFILPLIGTSVLHHSIDKLNDNEKNDFIIKNNYSKCKPDKKMSNELKKITYILPETELLVKVFKGFYKLENVYQLNNFRENQTPHKDFVQNDSLKIIFLSRIMEEKGIFDILNVIEDVSNNGNKVELNIYGKKLLNQQQSELFDSYLCNQYIHYYGSISNNFVGEVLSNNDIFVFPTHFVGEGTPGVIVESLIAGVPVLTSNFPQAYCLLEDGKDSIFYKMFDNEDLKEKIMYIIKNKDYLAELRSNAKLSGKKYLYKHERKAFLKYVCGVQED